MSISPDAVVVGSGPNGLAAAIILAQAGLRTVLREAKPTVGGGLRSAELTLPGFIHDVCAAVHPLALSSPFFRSLPLTQFGLEWIEPDAPLTHPLDGGTAAVLEQSVDATARGLGDGGPSWRRLHGAFARAWDELSVDVLASPLHIPHSPVLMARFGALALLPATLVARSLHGTPARALFAGNAAHSFLALEAPGTAAFGLLLGAAAHAVGWPIARGGSQRFADALASYFRSLGGEVQTDAPVTSLDELGAPRVVMLDLGPHQFARMAAQRLPDRYRRALERYRYGAAAFKLDWALDAPVPWTSPACTRSATVHLGGTLEEIAASEAAHERGELHDRPFVLFVQPTLFDATRAPAGRHTAWAYCHVPHGWPGDATEQIERQVERFAPGFRERILARSTISPAQFEQRNSNLVGGDINGGRMDLLQVVRRPVLTPSPYRTPLKGVYLCSASTPPGGGVHGMGGYHAAKAALADLR
ncbi:MAG TPA: NAD(P)/FAD-dependent oxidoreductase [Gemmatimonadales bacterium]|nr:NAD(P)/FAD-dependent oxidoreductase [Gemmatimonadales bacterium]